MQPLRLELNFFGPYRKETVDFSDFYANGLFLITGKTGAGKTTIFDGMSFALYGVTSGSYRQGKDMRSNFATPHDVTSVAFEFKYGVNTYHIVRQPAQKLAKKRGTDLKEEPAGVVLTAFDEQGKEVLQLTKQTEVKNKVEELLQLNEQQFSQIIMLPQGDFQKFLMSDSNDKEKILRKLFNTHFYQQIAETILEHKKKIAKMLQKESDHLLVLAQQLAFSSEYQAEAAEHCLLADYLSLYDQQILAYEAQEKDYLAEFKKIVPILEKVEAEVYRLEKRDQLIAKKNKVTERLVELEHQEAEINVKKELHLTLQKIKQLLPFYESVQELLSDQVHLRKKQEETQQNYQSVTTSLQRIQLEKETLDLEQEQMQLFEQKILKLAEIIPLFDQQKQLEQELEKNEKELKSMGLAFDLASQAFVHLEQEIVELKVKTKKKEAFQTESYQLKTQAREIDEALQNWVNLQTQEQVLAEFILKETQLGDSVRSARQTEEKVLFEAQRLKSEWAKEQIARLSLDLLPGEACPMCGSTEHPQPAHFESSLTLEELKELEIQVEKINDGYLYEKEQRIILEREQLFAQENVEKISLEKEKEKTKLYKEVQVRYNYQGDIDLYDFLKNLKNNLTEKIKKTEVAIQKCEQASLTLQEKEQAIIEKQEQIEKLRQDKQSTTVLCIETKSALAAVVKQIPEEWSYRTKSLAERDMMQEVLIHWQNQVAELKEQQAKVQSEQATLSGRLEETKRQLNEITAKLATRRQAFEGELLANGLLLTTVIEQKEQVKQIPLLEEICLTFDKEYYAKQEEIKQLVLELQEEAPGDLELEKEKLEQLKREKEQVQEKMTELTLIQKNNHRLFLEIERKEKQIKVELQELEELTLLSDVMNGDGQSKLSIERYCLQLYLGKILAVANQKLLDLSNGRYYLKLRESQGTYKKNTGLEMDIFDGHVGLTRGVNTLSGGESFMASLSLALSLAEVIQQIAGGIRIEAMFIDEGFGSLDEETLEIAMRSLEKIKGDGRLIGLISHVKELQQRIPQQLRVATKQDGTSEFKTYLEFR
ncbi:AAA family ATPase [Vagococcus sp.]|uniref:AAA family ATPase n=1 Tax=Vagococcus sp. TaxID=1933889 RepID=UPI003F9EB6F5